MVDIADRLFEEVLSNEEKTSWADLPQGTGAPQVFEKSVGSVFVRSNHYDHNCVSSTVLVVNSANECYMTERLYKYE